MGKLTASQLGKRDAVATAGVLGIGPDLERWANERLTMAEAAAQKGERALAGRYLEASIVAMGMLPRTPAKPRGCGHSGQPDAVCSECSW